MTMKTRLIILAAIFAALVSCGPKYEIPVGTSQVGFAVDFFKSVNAAEPQNSNVVVSPYSAAVALSMLAEGAEGQTKTEFNKALGNILYKAEDLGSNDTVIVKSANSVWIDDNFSPRNRYVSLLEKDFDAFLDVLNFADPATLKAINNWCSEHTNGKINEIIDELSPNDVMVLVNALYFKAPWLDPFEPGMTSTARFNGSLGVSDVKMMSRKAYMNYAEYNGCQLVELPYEGGRYSMYVLLPPQDIDINELISYLSKDAYETAIKSLQSTEVLLRMPKAKVETSLLLNASLQKMGVRTAFTGAADFKGISEMGPLSLGLVKQKCYVEISEKGTEAAAVTSAQIRMTAARPAQYVRMTVDRPYLFFITDTQESNIIFAGRIMNI